MPGLSVLTLMQIPLHRSAIVRWFNARLILWSVRWLMWRHRIRRPITWFVAPHVASLIGRLGESLSVYYVTDDHASMPGVDRDSMRAMDERLTRQADLVFVASDTLLDRKLALNPNTHYSPHGVDVEHFGRASDPAGRVPDDIRELPQPIIGFFGLIERWIDLELVRYLAEQRPRWTFLMIGRVAVPPEQVPALPNLHFIGRRTYEELPEYGRQFAAAILPFALTQEAWHANPLKLLEYLAMGKPAVSVAIPAAEKLSDVMEIAGSREEFLARLDQIVAQPERRESVQRRLDRASAASWDTRVAEVLKLVHSTMEQRSAEERVPAPASLIQEPAR